MSTLIFEKLAAIQKEIDPIGKDTKNQTQGFMFRGVDAVYDHLHPLLAKHEVFTTSKIIASAREERITAKGGTLLFSILDVEFTFHAIDGSSVSTQAKGEGMDSGDKGSNKAMAVAHKYALTQMFTIPYKDVPNPEAQTPPQSKPKLSQDVVDAIEKLAYIKDLDEMGMFASTLNETVVKNAAFRAAAVERKKELNAVNS